MKEKIRQYFDSHADSVREQILSLLSEMVKERTINVTTEQLPQHPFLAQRGEEHRVAAIVTRELEKLGIRHEAHSRQEGRPNVIGHLGRNENGRRLMVASHMDIVPAGDGWETDPYVMTVKDGFAYGRGVLDNKGPLAASLVAARILKEVLGEDAIGGEFQLAALSDEEATDPDGVDYGIHFLLERNLVDATFAIIPDIGENMRSIDVAEKGRAVVKIQALGKQAHGSTPERGVNAVYRMARLVHEIEELSLRHEEHPVLGRPSLNLGQIQGGAAPNIVPGECTIYLDIRTVPGMTREGLLAQLQTCCDRVGKDWFRMELQAWSEPHAIDPNNVLVSAIQSNSATLLGLRPEPFGMGGGTFAKALNLHGVVSVGWGPGDDEAFHVANEYVEIKQLVDFTQLLCLVSLDLVG